MGSLRANFQIVKEQNGRKAAIAYTKLLVKKRVMFAIILVVMLPVLIPSYVVHIIAILAEQAVNGMDTIAYKYGNLPGIRHLLDAERKLEKRNRRFIENVKTRARLLPKRRS